MLIAQMRVLFHRHAKKLLNYIQSIEIPAIFKPEIETGMTHVSFQIPMLRADSRGFSHLFIALLETRRITRVCV